MAEIVCSYSTHPSNEINYLILDTNVNFQQFQQFVKDACGFARFVVFHNNAPVENDEHLMASFCEEQPVHFTIFSLNDPQPEPIVEEPEPVLEEAEPEPEPIVDEPEPIPEESQPEPIKNEPSVPKSEPFKIGETLAGVLGRFGVEVDLSEFKPCDLGKLLPFPFNGILQDLPPEFLEQIISPFALMLQVSGSDLAKDIRALMNHLTAPAPEPIQKEPEIPVPEPVRSEPEQPKLFEHAAICDSCEQPIRGIRYKCLHCRDYDLCENCEARNAQDNFHDENHVFAKLYKSGVRGRCPGRFIPRFPRVVRVDVPRPTEPQEAPQVPNFPRFPRIEKLEQEVAELKQLLSNLKQ